MAEKNLPEIEKYNAVNIRTYEIPWHDTTKMEKRIELYFTNTGDVIIVGRAGDTYIYWLSVTKTEDMEANEQIYTRIANEQLVYVTYLEKALSDVNLTCNELEECYKIELRWRKERRRKNEILANWETPFGHSYTKEEAKQNGAVFARDIKTHMELMLLRCQWRECNGTYETVLRQYAEELKAATEFDNRILAIQNLLETEGYLLLTEQKEMKKWYLYCCHRCMELQKKKK